jgi:hypothetical protein
LIKAEALTDQPVDSARSTFLTKHDIQKQLWLALATPPENDIKQPPELTGDQL